MSSSETHIATCSVNQQTAFNDRQKQQIDQVCTEIFKRKDIICAFRSAPLPTDSDGQSYYNETVTNYTETITNLIVAAVCDDGSDDVEELSQSEISSKITEDMEFVEGDLLIYMMMASGKS